jgi:hypothetical protein
MVVELTLLSTSITLLRNEQPQLACFMQVMALSGMVDMLITPEHQFFRRGGECRCA